MCFINEYFCALRFSIILFAMNRDACPCCVGTIVEKEILWCGALSRKLVQHWRYEELRRKSVWITQYKERFIVLFVTPLLFRIQLKTNLSSIQQENATSTPTSLLSLMQDRYLLPVETCWRYQEQPFCLNLLQTAYRTTNLRRYVLSCL